MRITIAWILIALACPVTWAQDTTYTEAGLYQGYSYNQHSASFGKLAPFPSCCPEYKYGSGNGYNVALDVGIRLTHAVLFHLGLSLNEHTGTLTADENTFVADLRDAARVIPAVFRHSIEARLGAISLVPRIGVRPWGKLELLGGFELGIVTTHDFVQKEEIILPSDYGAYLGSKRIWNLANGEIPNYSRFRGAFTTGIRYMFEAGNLKSVFLAPEITYTMPLTNISTDVDWSVGQIRAGITIGWLPGRVETPPTSIPIDTILPIQGRLFADVTAGSKEVRFGGKAAVTISITESIVTELRPLLPYLFFEPESSEIPQRYRLLDLRSADIFSEMSLFPENVLSTYYHVLNILGYRMQQHTDAVLTITGCLDETEAASDNLALAHQRASVVTNYLLNIWQIDSTRIITRAQSHPTVPTRSRLPRDKNKADTENRRVEFSSNNAALLAPVLTHDTVRSVNPPFVDFFPVILSDAGVSSATLSVQNSDDLLFDTTVYENPDKFFRWQIRSDDVASLLASDSVTYQLNVVDRAGSAIETRPKGIPIEAVTISVKRSTGILDTLVEKYSLILFPFNSWNVEEDNLKLVRYIQSRISDSTSVDIQGFTDDIGQEEYNMMLSKDRGSSVARSLGLTSKTSVVGYGPHMLFPFGLPEGRMYNRTVIVTLRTPVTQKDGR